MQARLAAQGAISAICRRSILVAGTLLGCSAQDETSRPAPTTDQATRATTVYGVRPAPKDARIVSLSPIATRFLVELGVAPRLVAVDPRSRELLGTAQRTTALETTSLADAHRYAPDFVLLPALPGDIGSLAELEAAGARVVEFAPHDLEDVFALCRSVAGPLVGEDAATAFERRIARPLSLIAGQSPPDGRPRVVAIVSVDPPEIAGGHSFETDLIEIAGGSSLTHGGGDNRRPIDAEALARLAPDRVVVMTASVLGPADQDRALQLVGAIAPVDFFSFERETFWLGEPAEDAARLRAAFLTPTAAP